MPLHIGVNALFLIPGGVGGTEIYLRHLLAAIAALDSPHSFTVFLNQESAAGLAPAHPTFQSVQTGVRAASRPRRILYEQTALLRKLQGIDVLFNPGFTSPLLSPAPNVTVIHDLQHHRHPEFFKPADLLAWRFFVWASAKRSRRILTVSEASRQDIHSVYGVPLPHIAAAEPGAAPDFFALSPAGAEPLILCVSTLHPHKNIERLVDSFALFRRARPEYRLVLAGMRGFHTAAVERRIASHSLQDHVTITGWLPRHEVMALYARARIAVFPSTFEGYGMPVAEAMAAGVPLITSAIRPMMDIAGDTALLFPPHDTAALAEALERFAASPDLRATHAARARQRAASFTWERAARITLRMLEDAAARP
jgi:glycosyltransferase involved in cell wall biosynthesis